MDFEIADENLNNVIRSVVREHHWEPEVVGSLFIDRQDYEGLYYWYDDVVASNEELKKLNSKK